MKKIPDKKITGQRDPTSMRVELAAFSRTLGPKAPYSYTSRLLTSDPRLVNPQTLNETLSWKVRNTKQELTPEHSRASRHVVTRLGTLVFSILLEA